MTGLVVMSQPGANQATVWQLSMWWGEAGLHRCVAVVVAVVVVHCDGSKKGRSQAIA